MLSPVCCLGFLLFALTGLVRAEVVSLEIHRREPFADGISFGGAGAYEKIVGVARFAVDPNHAANRAIVGLDKAPRNSQGKVEFESDFYLLTPRDEQRQRRDFP